jgi:hypothetical protein
MINVQEELNSAYAWLSRPMTSSVQIGPFLLALLVFAIVSWFVLDNLNLIKEVAKS